MTLSRREFIKRFSQTAGCFAATASLTPLTGCSIPEQSLERDKTTTTSTAHSNTYSFPQGLASADPQPDAIILWTRAVSNTVDAQAVELRVQLASDPDFTEILLEQNALADSSFDFTVRIFVDGLQSSTTYYYRFLAPDDTFSRIGRTRTAPAINATEPLTVAIMSCQHYAQGFFSAYRRLINDDEKATAQKLDVIIHVGDYIYEHRSGPLGRSGGLYYADGSVREITTFPSVIDDPKLDDNVAHTLADYRHLYKTYLSDPDLQEARALFPFINTWDDHELINDYWQSYHPQRPLQELKVDINQAWFEYVPAALSNAPTGPAGFNPARDFEHPGTVATTAAEKFDNNYLSLEPNNLKAIGSLTIYRSLQWGKLADFVIVDGRSYRGERGLDTSLLGTERIGYPAGPVPAHIIETLNAGRTANKGNPPTTFKYDGRIIKNQRHDAPRGSLLGSKQKQWFKSTIENSKATWKLICNNVPMMRFTFDASSYKHGEVQSLWWTDSWDGYPIERRELTQFVRDRELNNVVSLSGDRHAQFAGLIYDDFDIPKPKAIIPEFVSTGVSANSRYAIQKRFGQRSPQFMPLISIDSTDSGSEKQDLPNLNTWLLYGAEAASHLAASGDMNATIKLANSNINPHLRYVDTDAYGYFTAHLNSKQMDVEFVTIAHPHKDFGTAGPPVRRRTRFSLPAWAPGEEPQLSSAEVEGELPFMGIKNG